MSAETILPTPNEGVDTGEFRRQWTRAEYDEAAKLGWFDKKKVRLVNGVFFDATTGQPFRLTIKEFQQAADLNWFADQRVELIEGEVYQKIPMNPPHATALSIAEEILRTIFFSAFYIRSQVPLPIPDGTDVFPDVAITLGSWRDYTRRHPYPSEIALVVEISDTTLHMDRGKKVQLYAEAGIQEYWVEDLNARTLIVHRDPAELPKGFGYRNITTYTVTDSVTPLAAPQAVVLVADLLPPLVDSNGDAS